MKRYLYILLALIINVQATAQNKASYTYDANNQLTQVVYANGTTVKYTYDALGNRLSKTVTTTQKQYTITLTASPTEGGKVTGAGTYYDGTTVSIKATANEGYAFSKWSDGDTNASRSIVANKNYSLTAYFDKASEPDLAHPVVTTCAATNITQTTATLSCAIDARGKAGRYMFLYGKTTNYDKTSTIRSFSALNYAADYSEEVTGLEPNTTYHYCIVANYTGGELVYGEDRTFRTKGSSAGTGIFGDVNSDGVVDNEDGTYIRDAYVGMPLDDSYCDLDGDGRLSVVDVTIMNALLNGTYTGGNNPGDVGPGDEGEPEVSDALTFSSVPYIWSESKVEVKEMVKGNTYRVYCKYKNYGSKTWEGDLYLLANSDTVKVWTNRDYEPGYGASINATYIPQSTGPVRFVLFCKPTGSKKSMLVAEGTFPSNPMFADVVDPAPANGSYRGYSYVNLGLPSGTLWASYNVGASRPEGTGNHYAWGETVGCDVKAEFHPKNYKYYNYDSNMYTKYWVDVDEEALHGITDNLRKLLPEDDAATANWGGNWRMPVEKERDELMNEAYTKWTLTTVNGIVGYRVESLMPGYVGNYIFLPLAGSCHGAKRDDKAGERADYLTSALDTSYPSNARFLYLTTDTVGLGGTSRYKGSCVRAVVSAGGIK